MPSWEQIVLYGRERGEAFLARARADIRARFGADCRIAERTAARDRIVECERAVAVYVEARFADIIAAYHALGVPVVTDLDLAEQEAAHEAKEARQQPPVDQHPEGQGREEELARAIPISVARRRRRGA